MIHFNFESKILRVDKFDININGVQLIETAESIEVRVDVFRSQPVFVFKNSRNHLFIFDNMSFFNSRKDFKKDIDEVGFWEIILFGNSLWSRTLFSGLLQLPSASSLKINKSNNEFVIRRYWDFNVMVNEEITNIELAANLFDQKLNKISKEINHDKTYCFGLSGGMDSRITLAYLSKHIKKNKLKIFTYANSKDSLEYAISKIICKKLGLSPPSFHKLTVDSYKSAIDYLPLLSGGQIGINHCHIIDNFIENETLDTYISTYFSDAIFGWESEANLSESDKMFNPFIDKIEKSNYIDEKVKNEIVKDSKYITDGYNINSNISSLREYIYVSERNQKFHNYLFSIQKEFIGNGINFYHDFDLFKFSLSIPIEFKHRKKIEYFILEKYFGEIASSRIGDISSNYFRPKNIINLKDNFKFKVINRINAILRLLTKGHYQVKNIFQTEELERVLHFYFKDKLEKSYEILKEIGIFNDKHYFFKKLPIKSKGTSERYSIITIATLFKKTK